MELKLHISSLMPPFVNLLIVPYGIETHSRLYAVLFLFLLIVPYGIETPFPAYRSVLLIVLLIQVSWICSFNRTLWN